MTTGTTSGSLVCFEAGGETYGVPLDAARFVRTTDGMIRFPFPFPDPARVWPASFPVTRR
jgi:hypothetical protein